MGDIAVCLSKEIGVEMGAALFPLDCVQKYVIELEKVVARKDGVTYVRRDLLGNRKALVSC
jgi:hypothetical protein